MGGKEKHSRGSNIRCYVQLFMLHCCCCCTAVPVDSHAVLVCLPSEALLVGDLRGTCRSLSLLAQPVSASRHLTFMSRMRPLMYLHNS